MNEDINQTQFSAESPLFTPEVNPNPVEETVVAPSKPWFKQPKFMMVGLGLMLLLLILSLLWLRPRPQSGTIFLPTNTPLPTTEVGPQQAKINELRAELEAADPAKQELPFPAVDMELTIPDERELR